MPSWGEIQQQIYTSSPYDQLRCKYVNQISDKTGRNVIIYYSGWLQKPSLSSPSFSISDDDKNGFMISCHGLDRSKGLDLILHTPGGCVAATESLIDYLYSMFEGDIRAIIPQLSMSGGTLLAVSCKEIIMGRESSLGPVDPQFGQFAAQSYLNEFERAVKEITENPQRLVIWQQILGKLNPGFLTTCQNALEWSKEILVNSLKRVMLKDTSNQRKQIDKIVSLLWNQKVSKNHSRHINKEQAKNAGLVVRDLEEDNDLQDLILSLHHLLCLTFQQTSLLKIISSGPSDRTCLIATSKGIQQN